MKAFWIIYPLFLVAIGCESSKVKPSKSNMDYVPSDTLINVKWAYYSFIYDLNATAINGEGKKIIEKPVSCNLFFNRAFKSDNGYTNYIFSIKSIKEDSLNFGTSPVEITGVAKISENIFIPVYHLEKLTEKEDTIMAKKNMKTADSMFSIYLQKNESILNKFLIDIAQKKGLIK